MTLVKVNPNRSLDGFVNDFFNDIPSVFGKAIREDVFSFPPVNITEVPQGYQLEVAAPGMDKADFSIKLEGNLLTIAGNKKEEAKVENAKLIRKEFSQKSFKRTFTVDEKIDAANIAAKYENGVLKLELPKKAADQIAPKEISIS